MTLTDDYYSTMAAEHRLAALQALRAENTRLREELGRMGGRAAEPVERYRHLKSGGVYDVICNAQYEAEPAIVAVVYRNTETGDRWVRPATEFNDGRFERIAAPDCDIARRASAASK